VIRQCVTLPLRLVAVGVFIIYVTDVGFWLWVHPVRALSHVDDILAATIFYLVHVDPKPRGRSKLRSFLDSVRPRPLAHGTT
jgi:hypothetical protein